MGNSQTLSCASGEKSTKAQRKEEQYTKAPVDKENVGNGAAGHETTETAAQKTEEAKPAETTETKTEAVAAADAVTAEDAKPTESAPEAAASSTAEASASATAEGNSSTADAEKVELKIEETTDHSKKEDEAEEVPVKAAGVMEADVSATAEETKEKTTNEEVSDSAPIDAEKCSLENVGEEANAILENDYLVSETIAAEAAEPSFSSVSTQEVVVEVEKNIDHVTMSERPDQSDSAAPNAEINQPAETPNLTEQDLDSPEPECKEMASASSQIIDLVDSNIPAASSKIDAATIVDTNPENQDLMSNSVDSPDAPPQHAEVLKVDTNEEINELEDKEADETQLEHLVAAEPSLLASETEEVVADNAIQIQTEYTSAAELNESHPDQENVAVETTRNNPLEDAGIVNTSELAADEKEMMTKESERSPVTESPAIEQLESSCDQEVMKKDALESTQQEAVEAKSMENNQLADGDLAVEVGSTSESDEKEQTAEEEKQNQIENLSAAEQTQLDLGQEEVASETEEKTHLEVAEIVDPMVSGSSPNEEIAKAEKMQNNELEEVDGVKPLESSSGKDEIMADEVGGSCTDEPTVTHSYEEPLVAGAPEVDQLEDMDAVEPIQSPSNQEVDETKTAKNNQEEDSDAAEQKETVCNTEKTEAQTQDQPTAGKDAEVENTAAELEPFPTDITESTEDSKVDEEILSVTDEDIVEKPTESETLASSSEMVAASLDDCNQEEEVGIETIETPKIVDEHAALAPDTSANDPPEFPELEHETDGNTSSDPMQNEETDVVCEQKSLLEPETAQLDCQTEETSTNTDQVSLAVPEVVITAPVAKEVDEMQNEDTSKSQNADLGNDFSDIGNEETDDTKIESQESNPLVAKNADTPNDALASEPTLESESVASLNDEATNFETSAAMSGKINTNSTALPDSPLTAQNLALDDASNCPSQELKENAEEQKELNISPDVQEPKPAEPSQPEEPEKVEE